MRQFSLIFCIILYVSTASFSQSTGYFKLAESGSFSSITRLSTGEYITVGYDSNYKIQLTKWSSAFDPIWFYKFIDTHIINIEPRVVESNDGNYYFMGSSSENSGSTLIVKFSNSGSILWQKIYYAVGGNLNSYALSRAVGNDDGFVFGGGQCILTNYVIKCDENGNIEWQKQYYYPLSTGVIVCNSIIADGDNYVVASGYNINSLLTFKLNSEGIVVAEKAYTYATMQIIPTKIIKPAGSNSYAILGNYNNSNDNKTQFVAFLNSDLTLNRFNELTVSEYTQFTLWDFAAINNGANFIAVGSIYNNSVFYSAMLNLQNNGNLVWKTLTQGNTATSNKNVELRSIVPIDNNYTVSIGHGYNEGAFAAIIDENGNGFCNNVTFNITNVSRTLNLQSSTINPIVATAVSATVNYSTNTDVSTTRTLYCGELPTDIEESSNIDNPVIVFPNPAQKNINIVNTSQGKSTVKIFSYDGKLVYQSDFELQKNIPVNEWPEGLYFIEINCGGKTNYDKVVILE